MVDIDMNVSSSPRLKEKYIINLTLYLFNIEFFFYQLLFFYRKRPKNFYMISNTLKGPLGKQHNITLKPNKKKTV